MKIKIFAKATRLFFLSLMLVITATSCNRVLEGNGNFITENRTLSDFTGVRSEGIFEVLIEKDSVQRVEVTAEENVMAEVETIVENGMLHIRFKDNFKIYRTDGVTIHIYSPEINKVELAGSGNIVSMDAFDVTNADILLEGSGEIIYASNCSSMDAKLTGSGDMTLAGTGTTGSYRIEGSGNIHAFDMEIVNADVTITGSGNCEVTATSTLDVTITGSGNVIYDGSPVVTTSILGSGTVKPR